MDIIFEFVYQVTKLADFTVRKYHNYYVERESTNPNSAYYNPPKQEKKTSIDTRV